MLLRRAEGTTTTFTRVGWMEIWYHQDSEEIPDALRWIVEYALGVLVTGEGSDIITIV